jgi:hypothetical protein
VAASPEGGGATIPCGHPFSRARPAARQPGRDPSSIRESPTVLSARPSAYPLRAAPERSPVGMMPAHIGRGHRGSSSCRDRFLGSSPHERGTTTVLLETVDADPPCIARPSGRSVPSGTPRGAWRTQLSGVPAAPKDFLDLPTWKPPPVRLFTDAMHISRMRPPKGPVPRDRTPRHPVGRGDSRV